MWSISYSELEMRTVLFTLKFILVYGEVFFLFPFLKWKYSLKNMPLPSKTKQKTTSMSSSNTHLLQDDLTRYGYLLVLDDMLQTNWKMKFLGKKHKAEGSGSDDWGQDARYSHAGRIGNARCHVFLIVPATCLPSTGLSLWSLLKCLLF